MQWVLVANVMLQVVLSNCVSIAGSGVYYSGLFTHDFLARSIYTLHVTSSVFQNMNAYLEGSSIWVRRVWVLTGSLACSLSVSCLCLCGLTRFKGTYIYPRIKQVTVENPMASAEVDLAITSSTFYESLTCITGELSPDDPSLASIPNQRETEDWVEDLISTMERLIDQNLTIATGQGALVVKSHTLGGKNFTAVVSDSSFERCEVGRCADELQDSQLGGAISIALTYSYQTQDIGIFDSTIANCRYGDSSPPRGGLQAERDDSVCLMALHFFFFFLSFRQLLFRGRRYFRHGWIQHG